MLYAHELIELMGAFPGRDFRMGDLVTYVRNGRELDPKQTMALRKGVERALDALESSGSVIVVRPFHNQRGWAYYRWKCDMDIATNATNSATLMPG